MVSTGISGRSRMPDSTSASSGGTASWKAPLSGGAMAAAKRLEKVSQSFKTSITSG